MKCVKCGNEIEFEYLARKLEMQNNKCFDCTIKELKQKLRET